MKTNFKLLMSAVLLMMFFNSCDKDLDSDFNSNNALSDDAAISAQKTYNEGMIKSYNSEMVLLWNETLSMAIDDKMPPPRESRIYAMVSLAVHDALNNVIPKYTTYALDNNTVSAKDISKKNIYEIADAAVAQAAHDVLVSVFPPATTAANDLLEVSLAAIEESEFKDEGIEVGKQAAYAILNKRSSDQIPGFSTYIDVPTPGNFVVDFMPWMNASDNWPEFAAFGAFLGDFATFGINTSDQFRAEPPYAINSQEYTNDYNEVKRLGCMDCPDRTEEQSEIGIFWIDNMGGSMNRVARIMSDQERLNGWETARLIALTHMVQMDANISSFEGKYHYKFWRPITAVRVGDDDGNEFTEGDADWAIFGGVTPPTPDYPSTHAECAGAAAELFKLFFKSDYKTFVVNNPYDLPGVERTMTSFSQIAQEGSLSRIYIGYHFRHAIEQGVVQGRKLAQFVFENNLTELKK